MDNIERFGYTMMVIAFSIIMILIVVVVKNSDNARTERVTIDGVDCIVTKNGIGHVRYTDCDWGSK